MVGDEDPRNLAHVRDELWDPLVKVRFEGVDEHLGDRDGQDLGGEVADRRAERNGPWVGVVGGLLLSFILLDMDF